MPVVASARQFSLNFCLGTGLRDIYSFIVSVLTTEFEPRGTAWVGCWRGGLALDSDANVNIHFSAPILE